MYGSPRYLDLQIICMTYRPVRDLMSGWPALPIAILRIGLPHKFTFNSILVEGVHNIIAALESNNR